MKIQSFVFFAWIYASPPLKDQRLEAKNPPMEKEHPAFFPFHHPRNLTGL